jgi:isochorismate pyruvate lyase
LDKEIKEIRGRIDRIDSELVALIGKRRELALGIAKIKQKTGSEDDEKRISEVLKNVRSEAKKNDLDPDEIARIWGELIDYMIAEQMGRYPY